jgi:capsular polysaccharide biosynthesis protein
VTSPDTGPVGSPVWASHALPERSRSVNPAAGLVSLSFIGAALRRRARLWVGVTIAGVILGAALFVLTPPPYQASYSLILKPAPTDNPADAMQTDVALIQTRAVAGAVVKRLGLTESVSKFLGSFTVAATTDEIMTITLSAKTSAEAVQRVRTLATAFLSFRASRLEGEQGLVIKSLRQEVAAAQNQLRVDSAALTQAEAEPPSASQKKTVSLDKAAQALDRKTLEGFQNSVTEYPTTVEQEISGSVVIGQPLALPRSKLRLPLQYVFGGLLLGLVVGMGIVIVGALASDRLRRRDDIARALGAPVQLSVGRVRVGGLRGPRGLAAANGPELQRIVGHLRNVMPNGAARPPALAVIPADNPRVAAVAAVSLALSLAKERKAVLFADLSGGAYAAKLLGVAGEGVRAVSVDGEKLVVAFPEGICPTGPLRPARAGFRRPLDGSGLSGRGLASAYRAADVVVTLARLDPALGGDHIGTWASAAVVLVTAGECTATGLGATAEMIRLAGVSLSAVLLGADKNDDSVGASPAIRYRQVTYRQPASKGAGVPG